MDDGFGVFISPRVLNEGHIFAIPDGLFYGTGINKVPSKYVEMLLS
jgi:hypothetical protein